MKGAKCGRLVYSSSATVYGTPKTIPIPETSPLQAESVYGRTKQMSEIMIKDVCDAYPQEFRAISLRYFKWVDEPHGSDDCGRGRCPPVSPILAPIATEPFNLLFLCLSPPSTHAAPPEPTSLVSSERTRGGSQEIFCHSSPRWPLESIASQDSRSSATTIQRRTEVNIGPQDPSVRLNALR